MMKYSKELRVKVARNIETGNSICGAARKWYWNYQSGGVEQLFWLRINILGNSSGFSWE